MSTESQPEPSRTRLVESAKRFGVQLDEAEVSRWIQAVATTPDGDDIVMDQETGVFGHKVSMLDFSPADLARWREVGKIVEFEDTPGVVETALALSGSAAQSKIQTYPGDCDYFERVNIIAPTRQEACQIFSKLMRDKALDFLTGPNYQLIEVKFGSYPQAVVRDEYHLRADTPMTWLPDEIVAGRIEAADLQGQPVVIQWDDVAQDPGWCKLDWLIADPARGQLANASNMLDVTWEAPDGSITPLDGYLDGYFQEVYLDEASAPIFNKLVKEISPDKLDEYVAQLESEVKKHITGGDPNYGKAAKRMYNIFRLNGQYEEAAFLRELFDGPAALLYQVHALMKTVEEAAQKASVFSIDNILDQTDELILSVIDVLEGDGEVEIVRHLLKMYRSLSRQEEGEPLAPQVEAAQAEVLNIVNNFFYEKMTANPSLKTYIGQF
ncbi:MAG: hypothetical protein ETSY2_16290 [Candidatus Entotheonella gemina]|uniref:Uncharacterized protein n=1 Tax=Candidatus Entotheonella gemina TaxID=1429439 RepID=W4MAB2_9BACT|nr:MAG: hypothetical protein ETSY2_16290 [Candidatus Entotheonella gemina]